MSAGGKKRYAAYCSRCGWGFTAGQSRTAHHCPRCGVKRKTTCRTYQCFDCGRVIGEREWRSVRFCSDCGSSLRYRQSVNPYPVPSENREPPVRRQAEPIKEANTASTSVLTVVGNSGKSALVFAKDHPFAAAGLGGVGGSGLVVAGFAAKALGGGIMTAGGIVIGLSMVGSALGDKNAPESDEVCVKGMKAGGIILAAGAAVSGIGLAVSVAGLGTLCASGGSALYGGFRVGRKYLPVLQRRLKEQRQSRLAAENAGITEVKRLESGEDA